VFAIVHWCFRAETHPFSNVVSTVIMFCLCLDAMACWNLIIWTAWTSHDVLIGTSRKLAAYICTRVGTITGLDYWNHPNCKIPLVQCTGGKCSNSISYFTKTSPYSVYPGVSRGKRSCTYLIDASNRYLGLQCRIQWNVQVLRSTVMKVRCSYIP